MDNISAKSPQNLVTPISTNISWESFLFKSFFELQAVQHTIPSFTNYYFNSLMKLVLRRTKKIKNHPLETMSEFSQEAQGDMKEKSPQLFEALGDFFNYNQYDLNKITTSYDQCLQNFKFLEKKMEKRDLFNEENLQNNSTTLI